MGSSAASQLPSWTGASWSGIPARPFPTLLPAQQVGHKAKCHQPLGEGTQGQARRGIGLCLSSTYCVPGTLLALPQLILQSPFDHLHFIDEKQAQRNEWLAQDRSWTPKTWALPQRHHPMASPTVWQRQTFALLRAKTNPQAKRILGCWKDWAQNRWVST